MSWWKRPHSEYCLYFILRVGRTTLRVEGNTLRGVIAGQNDATSRVSHFISRVLHTTERVGRNTVRVSSRNSFREQCRTWVSHCSRGHWELSYKKS